MFVDAVDYASESWKVMTLIILQRLKKLFQFLVTHKVLDSGKIMYVHVIYYVTVIKMLYNNFSGACGSQRKVCN